MGEGKGVYRVLVGRPEEKRPLGRPRHRWEDSLRWTLRIDGVNWMHLSQDRVWWWAFVKMVMNFQVPQRK
jgi:hypothetical protein